MKQFHSEQDFYSVLLHEMTHATRARLAFKSRRYCLR
ncbi:hypothetical protein [Avibacterium paragallinarum]|nr:hypothetical protein [Avibacterium paragallinarum]